jgi:hypothetical protein
MKKFSKSEDKKTKDTKEKDNRKYKKGDDSGSESDEEKKYSGSGSDGGGSDDGGGGEKFDMLEYRKMLAEIFPSKYMNERISKLESKEKNNVGHSKTSFFNDTFFNYIKSNKYIKFFIRRLCYFKILFI